MKAEGAAAPAQAQLAQVAIYHNIVWPKYKGAVFSALHEISVERGGPALAFVQIAQTDGERAALTGVDLRYHRYPFQLMFEGAYDAVSTSRLTWVLFLHVWCNPARVVVLPGYHRLEYWAMLLACMLRGKRRAVFCDSTRNEKPRDRLKALLKRSFFSRCDGYFGYGQRSAEYLRENGARAERIFQPCQAAALPIGHNPRAALAKRIAARTAQPDLRFLYVGRLSPEKDLGTLLQAFQRFRALRGAGQLMLVGAGPQREELLVQCQLLGLVDSVEFTGALDIDGLTEQYARALCLVLPSTSEPWGLVANEALHHGCPVIVSEVCGCRPELVVDGRTGFAFEPRDADALLGCMQRVADELADAAVVGPVCQQHMGAYTPRQAAARILEGCVGLLQGGGSDDR